MTERFEDNYGVPSDHGAMPRVQWEYLSELVLTDGNELALSPEEKPKGVTVGLADFHHISISQYGDIKQGAKAYASILRIAQDQSSEYSFTINSDLPAVVFWAKPEDTTDEQRTQYWASRKEQFGELDVSTLKDYVTAIDERLNGAKTTAAREVIYKRLGRLIGPATVDFWRAVVAIHAEDTLTN
jgi:hypothetical protein